LRPAAGAPPFPRASRRVPRSESPGTIFDVFTFDQFGCPVACDDVLDWARFVAGVTARKDGRCEDIVGRFLMNVLGHPCAKPPELLAHLVKLFVPAERSSITDRANHRD
jgi:hypothetical protein